MLKRDPTDMTIGTGNFTQGIPAFWFARAVDYNLLETLYTPYRDSAYVRRAIKLVSGPISSVDLIFSQPKTDAALRRHQGRGQRLFTARGIVRRQPGSEIELPQIRQWLREPMRGLTYEDFVEASLGWFLMQECFWILGDQVKLPFPEAAKNPFAPIIVPRPDRMRPTLENGEIIAWEFTDWTGRVWPLAPDQVVRLFGWNPYDPHRGLGDYPSAAIAAESHWLGGKFKRSLTADNDTAAIISPKNGTPTDTQIDQIKMQLAERRAARMRGTAKTLFMPGEIEVHDPKILSVDAAFITSMLEDRHEIFQAFGVPPSLADVKATYSIGQASDWFALIFNTCIPIGNKFCASLEKLIVKLTGEQIEVALDWDEHYVMQQVRSERMKDADSLFAKGMPVKFISDHLRLNLPRYEGDDVGYIPVNITPTQSREAIEEGTVKPEDYTEGENNNETDGTHGTDTTPEVQEMLRLLKHPTSNIQHRTSNGNSEQRARNAELWEKHMRLRSKSVKMFQSKCGKVFNEYRVSALRKLSTVGQRCSSAQIGGAAAPPYQGIFDPNSFGSDLFKQLEPIIRATLQNAGDELLEEIGQPDVSREMPPQIALQFVASRGQFIKNVSETAQSQLNTALQEGIENNETTDQLADRVRGVFNNLSKYEAKRIALTETSAAYGFARHQAMCDAGVKFKSWLCSHGPNAHPAHAAAEAAYAGNPISIGEPFSVGGEALMYPGDSSGSPGNVVNCHCIELAAIAHKTKEEHV